MKKNSRFDCLKDNEPKKVKSAPKHVSKPAPRPAPKSKQASTQEQQAQAQEPAPAPAPTQEQQAQAQEPAPAQKTKSWKDLISETKNKNNDILKPHRGFIIMYKNKNTIERIVHPLDIQEDLIRRQIAEEHRKQEHYEELRARSIKYFEYDLMVGNRDDFNSVEEYIEYLDKPIEELDNEEDEEEVDEEEYNEDYEEEYN